jgi:segregation and condensation protein B
VELSEIIPHLEALIFASEKPLTAVEMVELVNNALGFMEERIRPDQVEHALEAIKEKYQSELYDFEVVERGGGWQFLTKKAYHKSVVQLNGDKFLKRLTNAALGTLAIIAYKQPITKGEIETIRGVNSDYSVLKLLEKELILISGRNEALPGKPLLYTTSKNFMDYFGINSPNDLPKIKEVLADEAMNATIIKPEDFASNTASAEDSEISTIVVNEQGELLMNDEGNSNNENSENNEEDSDKNSEE